jgi:thioredoxin-dependent peroxiredoxin
MRRRDRLADLFVHFLSAFAGTVFIGAGCARPVAAPAPVAAPPDDLTQMLSEGTPAPDVAALDGKGKSRSLAQFRGKSLVLYFYPMDFAAGASAQADEFSSDFPKYRKLGASIVGVSTDQPTIHRDFAEKYKLPYPLLSDPNGEVARAFGVPLQAGTIRHATFLIDRRGVIRKVWPKVRPWGHSREVLEAVKQLPQ